MLSGLHWTIGNELHVFVCIFTVFVTGAKAQVVNDAGGGSPSVWFVLHSLAQPLLSLFPHG